MSKSTIMGLLKEVIYDMYDDNGMLRVSLRGELGNRVLSEAKLELLKNICDLVLNTNIISEPTKMYIRDRNIKVAQINEILNDRAREKSELIERIKDDKKYFEVGGKISINTTQSKITYDRKRLEGLLGSDILTNIIYKEKFSIENYQIVVGELLLKYKNIKPVREELLLNIDKDGYMKEYNGDFMNDFHSILGKYVSSEVKRVENELNSNRAFVGYFNYLLSGASCATEKSKKDREKLIELLSGKNVSYTDISNEITEESEKNKEDLNINYTSEKDNNTVKEIEDKYEIEDIFGKISELNSVGSQEVDKDKLIDKFSISTNKEDDTNIEKELEIKEDDNNNEETEDESYDSVVIKTQHLQF